MQRYLITLKKHDRIRRQAKKLLNKTTRRRNEFDIKLFKGYLDILDVQLLAPCEDLPKLGMDEHCKYPQSKLYSFRMNESQVCQSRSGIRFAFDGHIQVPTFIN